MWVKRLVERSKEATWSILPWSYFYLGRTTSLLHQHVIWRKIPEHLKYIILPFYVNMLNPWYAANSDAARRADILCSRQLDANDMQNVQVSSLFDQLQLLA